MIKKEALMTLLVQSNIIGVGKILNYANHNFKRSDTLQLAQFCST